MKIVVLDLPSTVGGGFTILKQYYTRAIDDLDNKWVFIIGKADLKTNDKITILKYPKIKKSWIHRILFEFFRLSKIIRSNSADIVISLQGTMVPFLGNIPQTLYLQQMLYFSKVHCSLRNEPRVWIYQKILSHFRKKDVQRANHLVVQLESTKNLVAKVCNVPETKFEVQRPICSINFLKKYSNDTEKLSTFFYPSGPNEYKNFDVVLSAMQLLKKRIDVPPYLVVITVTGTENRTTKRWLLTSQNEKLPVEFVGSVQFENMQNYYNRSALLFPSYIESFGLPLLEAKECNCPILAADLGYAREVVGDYDNCSFFDPDSPLQLAGLMEKYIKSKNISKDL